MEKVERRSALTAPEAVDPVKRAARWRALTIVSDPWTTRAALGAVLAAAWLARSWYARDGLPYLHHWDEPQLASTALNMLKTGDMNPGFFNYGSLMIYLELVVDVLHTFSLMGQEATAPGGLTGLDAIQTRYESGWHWTMSHPSYLYWNRLLVALMGTATVGVAYRLASELAGRVAGLFAAAALAGMAVHARHSGWVTNDAPMALMVAGACLFALLFLRRREPSLLLGSLALCGLAAATKYTAAVSLALPLAALLGTGLRAERGYRWWMWPALALVPALTFLAACPYALLDLRSFVEQAGFEVRHYQVRGHGTATVEAGLPHLTLQLDTMREKLGWPTALAALAGAGALLTGRIRRRGGWLVLVFPIVYMAFMCRSVVGFHRNYVVMYVFAAVALGCGAAALLWAARSHGRHRLAAAVVIGGAAWLAAGLGSTLASARQVARAGESRSAAVDTLNALAAERGWAAVGIARELRMQQEDLARLTIPYEIHSAASLICQDGAAALPAGLTGEAGTFRGDWAAWMSARLPTPMATVPGADAALDGILVNPGVGIHELSGGECERYAWGVPARSFDPNGRHRVKPGEMLEADTRVTSPVWKVPAGRYYFRVKAAGVSPQPESMVRVLVYAGDTILAEEIAALGGNLKNSRLDFTLRAQSRLRVSVERLDGAALRLKDAALVRLY